MAWFRTSAAVPTWVNDSGGQLIAQTSTPWNVTYTPQGGTALVLGSGGPAFTNAAGTLAAAEKIMAADRQNVIDVATL